MKLIIFFTFNLLASAVIKCQTYDRSINHIYKNEPKIKFEKFINKTSGSAPATSKKKKKELSFAFVNEAIGYPFSQFSKLFSGVEHPGVEIGYGFNLRTKNKHDWLQYVKLSYFYHRFVQHAFLLYTDFGYRYKFSQAIIAQAAAGAGYMQSVPATATLKLGDNGEYRNAKGIGRPQAVAVVNISVGYIFRSVIKKSPKVFITYQQFLQTPFVKAYVPILPYNSLLIGCSLPFQSNKK